MKFSRFLILLCLVAELLGVNLVSVKFAVKSPNLLPATQVFITGNHSKLGDWNPGTVRLEYKDGVWSKSLSFNHGTLLEYKFTLGNWSKEALDDKGHVFTNFTLEVTSDTVIVYAFSDWGANIQPPVTEHITGQIEYIRNLSGKDLTPRDVAVWLPPDYTKNPGRRYAVLYMHDGQNLFSARTAGYGVEWRIDEIADSLIHLRLIEPLIVVGIYNTDARNQEYATGDTGRCYRDFVIEQVKPLIDRRYRTLPDREHTATGGSSLGGLVAFILLWENPQIFSKAICMSSAFLIDTLDYVRVIKNHRGDRPSVKIYIDNGGIDLENELQPGIDAMLETLDKIGYRKNCDYFWVKDSLAQHNEAAWSRRIAYPLQMFFKP